MARKINKKPTNTAPKRKREVTYQVNNFAPRTPNQEQFCINIDTSTITFGVGAAGTGKSYMSVAMALIALQNQIVNKIVITRPVVEAGESLGFLPGTAADKLLPYLLPIYDSVDMLIGKDQRETLIEHGLIEIVPFAYMRGRSLPRAFIILDEAQNTTVTQMKMFLTRIGKNSKMVINGDVTQCDLRKWQVSGLQDAIDRLSTVGGISITKFSDSDIVRNPIIADILKAYD